jgi:hypothetical protein
MHHKLLLSKEICQLNHLSKFGRIMSYQDHLSGQDDTRKQVFYIAAL